MLLSGKKYLTAIYRLKQQGGRVRSVEVARYLGYTRPSVCRVISAFEHDGYLFREKGGILTLTKEGNDLAGRIVRRQDTIAGFLSLTCGVDKRDVLSEAVAMEEYISDDTFRGMKSFVSEAGNTMGGCC